VEKVENGLYVSVDYTGTLQNGEVFDSSQGGQPLEVKMGVGQLIEGFEKELMGMALNDRKTFTLSPEDAYGQRDDSLTRKFDRADFPPEMEPKVGMTIALQTPEGRQIPAQITHLSDSAERRPRPMPVAHAAQAVIVLPVAAKFSACGGKFFMGWLIRRKYRGAGAGQHRKLSPLP
jgi:peptidylprolyl isomerase